jgi:hypothetical protein
MINQAGDLAVEIDTGTNESGAVVQRLEGSKWQNYLQDGEAVVTWPIALDRLEPGRYRVNSNRAMNPNRRNS